MILLFADAGDSFREFFDAVGQFGDSVGAIYKAITLDVMPDLANVAPEVPRDVADLVARMLSRDPSERPHDLREVVSVLGRHSSAPVPEIAPAAMEATAIDGRRSIPTIDDTIDGTTVPSREKERVRRVYIVAALIIIALAGATIAAAHRGASSAPPTSGSH